MQVGLAGKGEQPSDSGACSSTPEERAISATPVIDRTQGQHGAIYVIASTKDSSGSVIQRIHAIDLASGAELFGGPAQIQASAPTAKGSVSTTANVFDPAGYHALSGMELVNGNIYAVWGSNCDATTASPWIIGFDARDLNSIASLSVPVASVGGPAFTATELTADSAGNLYLNGHVSTANQGQTSTTIPASGNSSDTVLKLSTDNGIVLAAVFVASPDGTVKVFTAGDTGLSATPSIQSGSPVLPTEAQISFSANGTSDEIQWTIENSGLGVLRAFDAADVSRELYNSTQAPNSRDAFPAAANTVSPTIAGGRVYLVTKGGVVVFGKLK
jgi:hypothetical protein